ncbi:hypothetical protein [Polyangium aurulentum]|uniref:hypothetical protein n=1 Tax=Polyangium aurulentum TaxID=2567896 RepID=UPI0010AED50A|nr:hypothetical protein [Polyangium aurulentum]UQA56773.1 hypothetical protein E8A73_036550 [Polyangium aurulentum]
MSEESPFEQTHLRAGAHEIWIEEPDFVAYRFRGGVCADEVRALTVVEHATWKRQKRVFVFIELIDAVLLPGTVAAGLDVYRGAPDRVVAIVGMSFSMRIGLEMVVRSLQLVGTRNMLRGFADETSARAWLREQRESHRNAARDSRA